MQVQIGRSQSSSSTHWHSKIAMQWIPAGGTHNRGRPRKAWRRTFQGELLNKTLNVTTWDDVKTLASDSEFIMEKSCCPRCHAAWEKLSLCLSASFLCKSILKLRVTIIIIIIIIKNIGRYIFCYISRNFESALRWISLHETPSLNVGTERASAYIADFLLVPDLQSSVPGPYLCNPRFLITV